MLFIFSWKLYGNALGGKGSSEDEHYILKITENICIGQGWEPVFCIFGSRTLLGQPVPRGSSS